MATQAANIPERFLQRAPAATDEVVIHPEDAPTVALFFALGTQWRRHPYSGALAGLDYPAIRPTAELAGIEITPHTLPGLRVMEDAALGELARRAR